MRLNSNIFPKTGFLFVDADKVRHVADSWAGVVARVKAYRKRRGQPEGDVEAEVTAQACAREPVICQNDHSHAQAVRKTSLKNIIVSWLIAVRGNQDKRMVEESLARSRAAVCAKCPKNTPLPSGCASCMNTLNSLRKEILGPRFVDGRLHACEVMGEDLPTVIHIDMVTVENGALPAECWRRRSL